MKKLIFYLFWLFIIGLMFTHSSCDNEPKEPTYYLDQEIKDYCYFQEGSWWKYEMEDSDSIQIDSVYCEEAVIMVDEPDRVLDAHLERLVVRLSSQFYKTIQLHLSTVCLLSDGGFSHFVYNSSENGGWVFPDIYFDPIQGATNKCGQSATTISHLGDYAELLEFTNVRVFETSDIGVNSYPYIIYWAKHVGIIKKVMPDGTVWVLKDFKVNQ